MVQSIKDVESSFMEYLKKMSSYEEALSLIGWDLRTGAPKKGVEQRSEVIGDLSEELFQMSISHEMKNYIDRLSEEHAQNIISDITKKSLQECKKTYDQNSQIPAHEYKAYVILQSQAEIIWEEARAKSDFGMFQPYLEKIVDYKKRFVHYWGYEGHPYNTLLDLYEPGVTVDMIDHVFSQVREHIVPLLQAVTESENQPNTSFLFQHFPAQNQKAFTMQILKDMGYDFEAGRLDETTHPFAIGLNSGDVRVTTRYNENDFRMAVFGTIHEGGHALYEQNIAKSINGTPLRDGASMGIHESQSLFWENFIGRSHSFWDHYYHILKHYTDDQFTSIDLDDYYRAINVAVPSLIRIEADELTYPLHIMVRYEIEKGLINDEIAVKDLPQIWNEKMNEYIGIQPNNDSEGVLQDVHWAGGEFGYFPSYALGYMYAAQIKHTMLKEFPHFNEWLVQGNLHPIKEWLNQNIHQYGKMKKPIEILQDVTGEGLNADYLIWYLEEKYKKIYRLDN